MAEAERFEYDVFLSHNSIDKPRVGKLALRLRAAGLKVWYDEWSIPFGANIFLAVEDGLQKSRVQVLCLTRAALEADWVKLERSTVLFRDPSNAGRRFLPLLLEDCALPDTLRCYKYLDFRNESNSAFNDLVTACRGRKPKPERPARRPPKAPASEPLAVRAGVFAGHEDMVQSIAVTPDGRWAASVGDDKQLVIWDMAKRAVHMKVATGHSDFIRHVSVTRDGKSLLTVVQRGERDIRFWDLLTGQRQATLRTKGPELLTAVPLSDGTLVVTTSWDELGLRVWDIATGKLVREIDTTLPTQKGVWGLAVSRDDRYVVAGGGDGMVGCWELSTGRRLWTSKSHKQTVVAVQITPDGRRALSASDDATIKVWDMQTGDVIGTLEGHGRGVMGIALSGDGRLLASVGFTDNTVRLWDWQAGSLLQVIDEKRSPSCAAFTPDGKTLLVGTAESTVAFYNVADPKLVAQPIPSRLYMNAKVVLVGESAVGKTTLAHRLLEDEYVLTDSTHGMNVWRLDIPVPKDDTVDREALLWDLAGQDDYKLIHQLFLEETALALLLINPQKDDPFAETGDWLKALSAIDALSGGKREVAKLLVATRIEVGGMKVSQKKIDQFLAQRGFSGSLSVSARRGDNCSDSQNGGRPSALKQLIAANIPWQSLPWTSTPRLLTEIKNAVISMRDETDIRLLRFAELVQRLEQTLPSEKFGEADVRTALTLLANHGLVRPLKFGDLVLLRPDILNGYAGAIIRAARAHKDEIGSVLEDDIYKPDFDFTGVDRLKHRADEELLLHALVHIFLDRSLCIAENTQEGRYLIFPSQFRRDRGDIPDYPGIFVTYNFSGELQTIYTILVVRLWSSREFRHKELWRNAAELETLRGHTLGILFEKTGEGEGAISLFFDPNVPEDLKDIFDSYVQRHLDTYGRDVRRDRRYVCQCGQPVTDVGVVRARLAANQTFITCQRCDKPVPLDDERLPVTRRVSEMDAAATKELDHQSLEQILVGHMMAITAEANQIYRPLSKPDHGIDGEVEFKDDNGAPSGRRIYIQLNREIGGDAPVFDVQWSDLPADVYVVARATRSQEETIRWMNISRYLREGGRETRIPSTARSSTRPPSGAPATHSSVLSHAHDGTLHPSRHGRGRLR